MIEVRLDSRSRYRLSGTGGGGPVVLSLEALVAGGGIGVRSRPSRRLRPKESMDCAFRRAESGGMLEGPAAAKDSIGGDSTPPCAGW